MSQSTPEVNKGDRVNNPYEKFQIPSTKLQASNFKCQTLKEQRHRFFGIWDLELQ
jgi:hypothetical protein